MTTETRPLEQQRRELRRRWVNLRDARQLHKKAWRAYMEAGLEAAARSCENMISAARDEMQHVAAQRLSTTARATRAEANSSCPAPGSASLTWSVVPTRDGWWLAFGGTLRYPVLYFVTDAASGRDGRLCVFDNHDYTWIDVRDLGPRWWSGPIELPEPWGGPTTPNEPSSATATTGEKTP